MKEDKIFLTILQDDKSYIAVSKPSGLLSISDRWDHAKDTLTDRVQSYLKIPAWAVHRLDKEASGVVLFAKSPESRNHLEKQFKEKQVKKIYHVLVEGEVSQDMGDIDLSLSVDSEYRGRMKIGGKNAKSSQTHFEVLERFRGISLLLVTPKTGRQHQIRLHLGSLGHPVCCDAFYGSSAPYYLSEMKRHYKQKKEEPEKPLMNRLALHASELVFIDMQGEIQKIESPLPKDFVVFLKYLRKFWAH